jgi:hypothetical protein
MLTHRSWRSTTVLLCVLLLQNCQSHSLRATEEEEPAASPPFESAMCQWAPSEPLAMRPLTLLTTPPPAAHVALSRLSTTLANEETLSTPFPTHSLNPPARHVFATLSNSLGAPYNLPAAARSRASHAVLLGNKPGHASSPDGPRVYLPQVERALRGMPGDPEEDSKPPAKQQSSDLDGGRTHKKACDEEGWKHMHMRREVLNVLLAMAGSEPDKATELLDVLLVAAQDKEFRQQALEALGKVAQASPNMFSACLQSLRAAAGAGDKAVRLLALRTLGEVEWKYYFGKVGATPDLPSDMVTILDSPCPFWPSKKVRDTHLLVLIPATVDGAPFSLNLLKELIQHPKNGGHKTKYRYYASDVQAQLGASSLAASYWLLMTRDVLPGSRDKTYANQKKLVAAHARRTSLPYELPTALEAATAILAHHVRNGERLYSKNNNPWTYTRCQELIYGEYPAVVGGFEPSGLDVSLYGYVRNDRGIAGCRKF